VRPKRLSTTLGKATGHCHTAARAVLVLGA
jgi:hypothetical protein